MSSKIEQLHETPDPVVIGLVQMSARELLIIRRAVIPPDKHFSFPGELALPGGLVKKGAQWREELAREIEEEAHVVVSSDRRYMHVFDAESTPNGGHLLLFAKIIPTGVLRIDPFTPTRETDERHIVQVDHEHTTQLGIPLHQVIVDRYREQAFSIKST
ncbi:NUDIX domain-containing protein [Candidatus Kaiserbacteria bacterium]|nr:NUDIX domain-containing protein [Candidatus Kaiserbacteria bacterium]